MFFCSYGYLNVAHGWRQKYTYNSRKHPQVFLSSQLSMHLYKIISASICNSLTFDVHLLNSFPQPFIYLMLRAKGIFILK